jgi:hypothetical protein
MTPRIAASPLFAGLRQFHQGRAFKQWTGNDSRALMKVWLPAITGLVPDDMVRCCRAFLEFAYIVRKDQILESDLQDLDDALERFHRYRQIFITTGVRTDFEVPRQHAMCHYRYLIEQFGAPNGLCTSITEHAHIAAIKEPWRRTNKNEPLAQMLLIHNRLSLLAAYRTNLEAHGLLKKSVLCELLSTRDEQEDDLQASIHASSQTTPELGLVDDHEEMDTNSDPDTVKWRKAQRRLVQEEDDDEPSGELGHSLDADVVLAKSPGMSMLGSVVREH